MYGTPIGTLYESGDRFGMTFDQDYIAASPPPVLSLAFLNTRGRPRAPTNTSVRIIPFFANLLPEPNSRLRHYLAAQSDVDERDNMALLDAFGGDLPGAVTMTRGEWDVPRRFQRTSARSRRALRFSLGGVQMKFSVRRVGESFILPADGVGGTHILKLPEPGKPDLAENEAAMMRFAAQCGIEVPAVQLVSAKSVQGLPDDFSNFRGSAYVIERFDRSPHGPIHAEDFAQILETNPEDKYERTSFDNLMHLCAIVGDDDLAEFVRRLVFTIAIANADAHLKNWSMRYIDPYRAALSPAYDYVCTGAYPGYDDFLALPLADTVRWEGITRETFFRAARNARVAQHVVRSALSDMLARITEAWPLLRDDTGSHVRTIVERQLRMPLFKAA